jgi:hypothetical protein
MPDDALSPISLSDDQLSALLRCAEPLPPQDGDRFLRRVAELLRGRPIGDGTVALAARQAQAELFKPPQMIHSPAPRPRHAR